MIRIMGTIMLVLVISIGFLVPKAAAQSDKYPKMAPVNQYLMERNAEILLARSAAPDSISSDATILVLGRQGYETAVRGKNGFVCMVERSWMAQFDSPERIVGKPEVICPGPGLVMGSQHLIRKSSADEMGVYRFPSAVQCVVFWERASELTFAKASR